MVKVGNKYGLVDAKPRKNLCTSELFVLVEQAHQIDYIKYPFGGEWCVMCEVKPKLFTQEIFDEDGKVVDEVVD